MLNICRPFTLYNDFIPPVSGAHEDWRYFSYGYYDGLTVGDNLFEAGDCDLSHIWNYYLQQNEKLKGSYLTQTVYGLRNENTEEKITDKEFWSGDSIDEEYPFVFLSLIQIDRQQTEFCEKWKKRDEFEQKLNEEPGCMAIVYMSFDNSDIVLALRSKNYLLGARIIDELHSKKNGSVLYQIFGWELKYSFTVASISKKVMEDKQVETMTETIPTASIYMIEKYPGSIEGFMNELKKHMAEEKFDKCKQSRKSTLGCNDEIITIEDISWGEFLKFYRDETGILNGANPICKKYLNGVTTILGIEKKYVMYKEDLEHGEGKAACRLELCNVMRKKCNNILNDVDGKLESIKNIQKNLYQMINSLQKFEDTPFTDYVYLPIMLPLNMLLDMLEKKGRFVELEEIYDSFYGFMKGFNLCVQNSNRSDRQFTQTPEYNIKIYDIPAKLNAYYCAYIYNLRNYLNTMVEQENEKHEYEFLLCPGITNSLRVKEYFKKMSDEKRVFLIEIPERAVFEPKMMLLTLTHELGHVVGTGIRKRVERTNSLRKIACKIICEYTKIVIQKKNVNIDEMYWETFEKKLMEGIFTEENTGVTDIFRKSSDLDEEVVEKANKRVHHGEMVVQCILDNVSAYINKNESEIYGYLLEKEYLCLLKKQDGKALEKKEDLRKELLQLVGFANGYSEWNGDVFNIKEALNITLNLMRECLADIVCILTLRLSMKEYLDAIVGNAAELGYTDFYGTEMLLRSTLVTFCMSEESENSSFMWNDESLTQITDDVQNELKKNIIDIIQTYLLEQECEQECEGIWEIESALEIIYTDSILQEIAQYLNVCKEAFNNYNKNEEQSIIRERLQYTYQMFENDDVENLIMDLQQYIEKYLFDLRQELKGVQGGDR